MLHFDVQLLDFSAIFVVKICENCYDFLTFRRFSAAVAWKNVVSAVRCLVSLLTTNTSSLVDVEVGRNCELLLTLTHWQKGRECVYLRPCAVVKGRNSHIRPCTPRVINVVLGKRHLQSRFKRFV